MATAAGAGGGGGCGGEGDGDGGMSKTMPMSMWERARLAPVPQLELGLKCPRCDSTNTKFCYFNNYSLSQPRHFCRACRRYWTRGGALRNFPVGGDRRRSKRCTKPESAAGEAGGMSSAESTTPDTATTCTGSATVAVPAEMH